MLVQHNDYQYNESFLKAEMLGRNEVLIINCQFVSNTYFNHLFLFSSTSNASVKFVNCKFVNNGILDLVYSKLLMLYESINVELNNCEFYDSIEMVIDTMGKDTNPSNVIIKNTNYSTTKTFIHYTKFCFRFISLSHTTLTLVDSVNTVYGKTFEGENFRGCA